MPLRLHHRLMQRAFLAYSRVARGVTLGVRAMMLKDGHVVLVKHSYVPGWYFPGGGVEPGESVGEALAREIQEETGGALTGPTQLYGIYRNAAIDPADHVALYVCRDWELGDAPYRRNAEIIACDVFPLAGLPDGVTPATVARIREVLDGEPRAADW